MGITPPPPVGECWPPEPPPPWKNTPRTAAKIILKKLEKSLDKCGKMGYTYITGTGEQPAAEYITKKGESDMGKFDTLKALIEATTPGHMVTATITTPAKLKKSAPPELQGTVKRTTYKGAKVGCDYENQKSAREFYGGEFDAQSPPAWAARIAGNPYFWEYVGKNEEKRGTLYARLQEWAGIETTYRLPNGEEMSGPEFKEKYAAYMLKSSSSSGPKFNAVEVGNITRWAGDGVVWTA